MIATRTQGSAPSTAFLVERYLRVADIDVLSAAVARLGRHCADSGPPGARVQYLQAIHLPTEDTCFCLLRAPSASAVRDINRQAGFEFDRITPAVLLSPNPIPPQAEDDMS
jgi:Protein of unknown function (DUF4242)